MTGFVRSYDEDLAVPQTNDLEKASLDFEATSKENEYDSSEYDNAELFLQKEVEEEAHHDINYRNCSWQKTAGLLFSEYICLAIMSFPWSYSVLGLGLGLIVTVIVALLVLYTGLIISDYCAAYPHLTNVCDIGQHLFWGKRWVWYLTAICFLLNNTLIQSLHVLVGAKYFNTISDNKTICSIVFGVISAIICFLFSLPRTFSHMSSVGYFSAATMFIAVVLSMIFAGIQNHPNGWKEATDLPIHYTAWPEKGTTYVSIMSAVLNIVYTFVGQITYPSFISQMKQPKEFKKALWAVTICELIVFALAGSIVYVYVGNNYITAPAFGSLSGNYKKIAFSFALPTIIFLGALYSNVSSQFLFQEIFSKESVHRNQHTVKGWLVWGGLNAILWVFAFVIAEVIPFFSDLLSLMSSLFDCSFGFFFWARAFFKLKKLHYKKTEKVDLTTWEVFSRSSFLTKVEFILNYIIVIIGFYILGPGLYATIQSIVWSYQDSLYGKPFSCASNGL
ncbi:transmembrane amino acid transporter protein-domain-containing protein [Scheffersomyces xylosifermentans]|uniref:transmembrane amino acid transporter protein-domain-containing protein n=1 Tax=Scheffersomyces xylosifermentans TaxID=1304137 RepID=UPI00315CB522